MAEAFALHAKAGTRGPSAGPGPSARTSLRELVEAYERRLILDALARANGNQRRAAAELGCLPTTLNEKMRRLGLRACDRHEVGAPRDGESSSLELTGTA